MSNFKFQGGGLLLPSDAHGLRLMLLSLSNYAVPYFLHDSH